MDDGTVILCDGTPVPVEQVVAILNSTPDSDFPDRLGALIDEVRGAGNETYARMIGGLVLAAFDLCMESTVLAELHERKEAEADDE